MCVNLPAIPVASGILLHFLELFFSKPEDLFPVNLEHSALVSETVFGVLQVHLPDRERCVFVQSRIVKAQMDAAAERLVDDADAVCRQEENSAIVFKDPQEDGNYSVSGEILFVAFLQEYAESH